MNYLPVTVAILLFIGACASPVPSAKAGKELEAHAATLIECRKQGREAGTYVAYADCKKDAGIE